MTKQRTVPKVGDAVVYVQPTDEKMCNGHRDHAAVITAVHGDDLVNLKVFFDLGPVADKSSIDRDGNYGAGSWYYAADGQVPA